MEIRTVLDLFSVIPAIFDLEVYFALANVAIRFICILNIFYDGETSTCNI